MALQYGYFDSEISGYDEEGMPLFDRAKTSDFLALFLSQLISDGVFAVPANSFQVVADTGMQVKVKPGYGMVKGRLAYDENEAVLTIQPAPTESAWKRIDRVVLRNNYPERICEIIVKTGTPAAQPVAPEILQPAAGDYYELSLATIYINSNQTVISQANITDTRLDSAQCGIVTQLIDHLDTNVFYEQLNAFYVDFVAQSEASYAEFVRLADEAFAAYGEYLDGLEASGDTQLTAIVDSMREFQRQAQADFNDWFATVQGLLDEDIAGRLINITDEHEARLSLLEEMTLQNQFFAPIRAEDDSEFVLLADDEDNVIVADWKYQYQ